MLSSLVNLGDRPRYTAWIIMSTIQQSSPSISGISGRMSLFVLPLENPLLALGVRRSYGTKWKTISAGIAALTTIGDAGLTSSIDNLHS